MLNQIQERHRKSVAPGRGTRLRISMENLRDDLKNLQCDNLKEAKEVRDRYNRK